MTYNVTEADLEKDRDEILSIWRRNAVSEPEKRYSWIYSDNPFAPVTAWLVKDPTGKTVGSTGLITRTMKMGDRDILAGQGIDLVVDREHRTVGPVMKLQKALTASLKPRGITLVYAFPNRQSEGVLVRAGYRYLGEMKRWTKPLRTEYILRQYIPARSLSGIASTVLDMAMRMTSRENRHERAPGVTTEIRTAFDSRFDILWSTAAVQHGIIGDRGSSYLTWRFQPSPDRRYFVFCLLDGSSNLLGYIVYSRQDNRVTMADILFQSPSHIDALLAEFMEQMRSDEAHSVTINHLGSKPLGESLKKFGFYRRPVNEKMLIYQGDGPNNPMLDGAAWHMTDGDKDV